MSLLRYETGDRRKPYKEAANSKKEICKSSGWYWLADKIKNVDIRHQ
jgi:hypothetical protein